MNIVCLSLHYKGTIIYTYMLTTLTSLQDTVRKLKMFTSKEEPYLPTVFAGYPASFAFDWISGK